MARAELPPGIDRERHQNLTGRGRHVWQRRAALTVIFALPVLGLLNIFGQRAGPATYQSPAASLVIDSPGRVRGGLVFTTEIVITPHRPLRDARLYLDGGWFTGMTFNGVTPQPSSDSAQGQWEIWDFGKLPTGTAYRMWISWQANPTNHGRHPQDVALYDGGTRLMTIRRTLTVFP